MVKKNAVVANRVFLLSLLSANLLTLSLSMYVSDIMILQFFTEFFLILPAAIYLFMIRRPLSESIGIRKISVKQFLLLIPIAFCVSRIAEFLNVLSQLFTKNEIGDYVSTLATKYPFVITFFVIAVMPAICEETVYRGVVYQGYRRGRILTAGILSAFLFGAMHMNLNQFIYAFALGIMFAIVNEAVGSMVPSMLLHLYVNGRSTVVLYSVIGALGSIHEKYVAAMVAGDTKMMDFYKSLVDGFPIEMDNWLELYLASEDASSAYLLPMETIWMVISVVALFFLIRLLARMSGREQFMKKILKPTITVQPETSEEPVKKTGPLYFVSPSLIIGILLCFGMMVLSYLSA